MLGTGTGTSGASASTRLLEAFTVPPGHHIRVGLAHSSFAEVEARALLYFLLIGRRGQNKHRHFDAASKVRNLEAKCGDARWRRRRRRGLSALAHVSLCLVLDQALYQLAPEWHTAWHSPARLWGKIWRCSFQAGPRDSKFEGRTRTFCRFLRGLRTADSYQGCPRYSGLEPTGVRGPSVWGLTGSWG